MQLPVPTATDVPVVQVPELRTAKLLLPELIVGGAEKTRAVLPVSLTVMVLAALVLPCAVEGNVTGTGELIANSSTRLPAVSET